MSNTLLQSVSLLGAESASLSVEVSPSPERGWGEFTEKETFKLALKERDNVYWVMAGRDRDTRE